MSTVNIILMGILIAIISIIFGIRLGSMRTQKLYEEAVKKTTESIEKFKDLLNRAVKEAEAKNKDSQ